MSPLRLAALLLLAAALACYSPEERARRASLDVREALARDDPEAARAALERLRDSAPDTPESVQRLAQLMVRAGEGPQALWLLDEAVQRFPERDNLRLAFARTALLLGEPSRARAALEPIGVDSLVHPEALVMRARASLELGDLEGALAQLEEAEEHYPGYEPLLRIRIRTLLQEQRFDEAREAIAEAREQLDPEQEAARELDILAARLDAGRGEMDAAAAALQRLVEEDPGYLPAWNALLDVFARAGRFDEALELLQSALDEDPERRALYSVLANAHRARGEGAEAEAVLRRLVEVAPSPSSYLTLAQLQFREIGPEGMLEVLEEALRDFPDSPMLRVFRAELLIDVERLEEAQQEFAELAGSYGMPRLEYLRARLELAEGDAAAAEERLRGLVPEMDQAETHLWLGRALEAQGDLESAYRHYGLAQQRRPNAPAPILAMLAVAQRRGDLPNVVSAARALLRFPRHTTTGLENLAQALLLLGRPGPAEQIARSFVEGFPDELIARLLLARALWRQERTEEAKEALAEAEEHLGPRARIAAEHALLLGTDDRIEEGIAVLERALEESPDHPALLQTLAGLHFQGRDFEAGSAAVDRALELHPDDPTPLRLRAEYAAAHGPLPAARRDAEAYLERAPEDADMHLLLGSVHARQGRIEAAIAAFRRAAELDASDFSARHELALLLEETGDLEGALEAAQDAYARAAEEPAVLGTLGWLYFQRGLVERSLSLLEEAHEASPERPDTQLHLALAYREAGRTEEARRLLSELVARADSTSEIHGQAQDALHSLP